MTFHLSTSALRQLSAAGGMTALFIAGAAQALIWNWKNQSNEKLHTFLASGEMKPDSRFGPVNLLKENVDSD